MTIKGQACLSTYSYGIFRSDLSRVCPNSFDEIWDHRAMDLREELYIALYGITLRACLNLNEHEH